jgi:hypothetical protein
VLSGAAVALGIGAALAFGLATGDGARVLVPLGAAVVAVVAGLAMVASGTADRREAVQMLRTIVSQRQVIEARRVVEGWHDVPVEERIHNPERLESAMRVLDIAQAAELVLRQEGAYAEAEQLLDVLLKADVRA